MKLFNAIICLMLAPGFYFIASAEKVHFQDGGRYTQHFNDSLFKITEKGEYGIETLWGGKELKTGKNDIKLVVRNKKDQDVEGARITVEASMPQHGHEAPMPRVKDEANGLYRVKGLRLSMPGKWRIKITVDKDGAVDSAVFDVLVKSEIR